MESRYKGSLMGLAVGDALGTTLEFRPPGTFAPITDMVGGGPFNLEPGQWTDDTSTALCLAESLVECGCCNLLAQHSVANGNLFSDTSDIGPRESDICLFLSSVLRPLSSGFSDIGHQISDLWPSLTSDIRPRTSDIPLRPEIDAIAAGSFKEKDPPEIRGAGYVVDSLEAALWAFHRSDSFKEGALLAVNLGDDADTTGAVYGQIAGTYCGIEGLPIDWVEILALASKIEEYAEKAMGETANLRGKQRGFMDDDR